MQKLNADKYRVTSQRWFGIFKSTESDYSSSTYSSGVIVIRVSGDCVTPSSSIIFVVELNSGLGRNGKHSSRPSMLNLTSPIPTSMWAFTELKKGLPRMSDTLELGCMSRTQSRLV
jgi:hypothetical protein